jgi:hypothetical protein
MLTPLLAGKVAFVSLQKDIRPQDAVALNQQSSLIHYQLGDFGDVAALIDQLDLVISIDTSVAHLAGALAKPVWILLHFFADWRWTLDRKTTPWYPTARLFRQDDRRDWLPVIENVRAELHQMK